MSVVAAFVPAAGRARFASNALSLSPTVDVIKETPAGAHVHISGTQERALRTLIGTGANNIAVVFYKDKPGTEFPGVEGHGIPNKINEEGEIMDVQGGTLSVADLSRKPRF